MAVEYFGMLSVVMSRETARCGGGWALDSEVECGSGEGTHGFILLTDPRAGPSMPDISPVDAGLGQ